MFKFLLISIFSALSLTSILGQNMNNNKLEKLLTKKVDSINGYTGYWEIIHEDRQLLCITDEKHNRMRIISPIIKTEVLSKELLLDALTANFHAALDVRYAESNGVIWSAFIHPLKELSDVEVDSAVDQVVNAAKNFGTTFSSTEMIFGGSNQENINEEIQEEETPKEELPVLDKKL